LDYNVLTNEVELEEYKVGDKVIFIKWVLFGDLRGIKGVIYDITYHRNGFNFYRISYVGENDKQKTCNLFPIKGRSDGDESMVLDTHAIREDEINKILNIYENNK